MLRAPRRILLWRRRDGALPFPVGSHLSRSCEDLRPVDAAATRGIDSERNCHVREFRAHQIGAMVWTADPAVHGLISVHRAARQILPNTAPAVSRACYTVRG